MNRRLSILIGILLLALIGAGVVWWFNQDAVSNIFSGNANSTTSNTNTIVSNTNQANRNISLPSEIKGDVALDQKATVAEVELHFSSVSKLDSYEGEPAGDGKMYVVVFFDAVKSSQVLAVQRGLVNGIFLVSTKGVTQPGSLKVASDTVGNDRGYIKFLVASDAKNFSIQVGSENGPRFALPL